VSLLHPVFKRLRDDKGVNTHDVRYSQITGIVYIEESESKILLNANLPKSEIVFREVYTKQSKDDTSVQIKRDARISARKEPLVEMAKNYINASIKKGWNKL